MEGSKLATRKWTVWITAILIGLIPMLISLSVTSTASTMLRHTPNAHLPEYPFIRYDQNQLRLYGDSTVFYRFYNQLDELIFDGSGEIDIMHMGGSHVQAGVLSNRLRENFFSLAENVKGGRGFLFPYRLARTNGPSNFKVKYTGEWEGCKNSHNKHFCNWGVSGYSASTADSSATIKLWSFDTDSVIYPFTRVKVFYDMNPNSFNIKLDSNIVAERVLIDSLAHSIEFYLDQAHDTLFLELEKTDSLQNQFAIQGIVLDDFEEYGISYHAVGVNGASVPSYLRCNLFEQQLHSISPDLVIFGIGINDAYKSTSSFKRETFEANYDTLISMIRTVNPNVNFLFLTNNDSYYRRRYANRNALEVRNGMINLAKKYNGAVWDLFEIMGGLNSITTWNKAGLAKKDKIHFTSAGYILEADLLFEAIRRDYGDYLQAK